jgi:hypothetical protein
MYRHILLKNPKYKNVFQTLLAYVQKTTGSVLDKVSKRVSATSPCKRSRNSASKANARYGHRQENSVSVLMDATEGAGARVMHLPRILEVLGPNLGWDTDHSDCSVRIAGVRTEFRTTNVLFVKCAKINYAK